LNNNFKVNTSKGKIYLTVVAMASLLLMAFNVNSNMSAYASIFENIQNADDVGQSLECVIIVVGCEAVGSVGSSGDVIVGSGNDDNNTNGGGDEPGILTVFKIVQCESNGGSPDNNAVCNYAINSNNFPGPEDYQITVTGNDPDPSSFSGSSTGTPVSLGSGDYTVDETLANTATLQAELNAASIITQTTAEGDCTPNFDNNQIFEDASGTMTSGGSQECILYNLITIGGGTVPE
jgi:hypothetical protein